MTKYEFTIECYNLNSKAELEDALRDGPTQSDLDNAGLDEDDWIEAVKDAIKMIEGSL